MQLADRGGFQVALQEDEYDGNHFVEDVGWIALSIANGTIGAGALHGLWPDTMAVITSDL